MRIKLNAEELETLIVFHEHMRDDAIGSCEDEEAEQRRERILLLRTLLKQIGDDVRR